MPEVGEVVLTMCVGHIVEAEVVKIEKGRDPFVMRFIRHFPSGKKRLCLDLGQRWYITEGELFFCGLEKFEAAQDWKSNNNWKWEVKELKMPAKMPAKILVNQFKEKNFTVRYKEVYEFRAEWNRDTGLSVSMPSSNAPYTKKYLEPEEAEAFSKWLNDCLSE